MEGATAVDGAERSTVRGPRAAPDWATNVATGTATRMRAHTTTLQPAGQRPALPDFTVPTIERRRSEQTLSANVSGPTVTLGVGYPSRTAASSPGLGPNANAGTPWSPQQLTNSIYAKTPATSATTASTGRAFGPRPAPFSARDKRPALPASFTAAVGGDPVLNHDSSEDEETLQEQAAAKVRTQLAARRQQQTDGENADVGDSDDEDIMTVLMMMSSSKLAETEAPPASTTPGATTDIQISKDEPGTKDAIPVSQARPTEPTAPTASAASAAPAAPSPQLSMYDSMSKQPRFHHSANISVDSLTGALLADPTVAAALSAVQQQQSPPTTHSQPEQLPVQSSPTSPAVALSELTTTTTYPPNTPPSTRPQQPIQSPTQHSPYKVQRPISLSAQSLFNVPPPIDTTVAHSTAAIHATGYTSPNVTHPPQQPPHHGYPPPQQHQSPLHPTSSQTFSQSSSQHSVSRPTSRPTSRPPSVSHSPIAGMPPHQSSLNTIPHPMAGNPPPPPHATQHMQLPPPPRRTAVSPVNSEAIRASVIRPLSMEELDKMRTESMRTNDPTTQLRFARFAQCTAESMPVSGTPANDPRKRLLDEVYSIVDRFSKANSAEAIYIKGTWFATGKMGNARDNDKALKYFQRSAKLGFPKASYQIGRHYENDPNRAMQFYQRASALGDPEANFRMGTIYLKGELKQKVNPQQALKYMKRAATASEPMARAALLLAELLADRHANLRIDPIDLDPREAVHMYHIAAELDEVVAQRELGRIYEDGLLDCPRDPAMSVTWFQRAADCGDAVAALAMSAWCIKGVPGRFDRDDRAAFEWCRKAVEQGLADAEYAFGYYHEAGIGVQMDRDVAIAWFRKAASGGSNLAHDRLQQLEAETKSPMASGGGGVGGGSSGYPPYGNTGAGSSGGNYGQAPPNANFGIPTQPRPLSVYGTLNSYPQQQQQQQPPHSPHHHHHQQQQPQQPTFQQPGPPTNYPMMMHQHPPSQSGYSTPDNKHASVYYQQAAPQQQQPMYGYPTQPPYHR